MKNCVLMQLLCRSGLEFLPKTSAKNFIRILLSQIKTSNFHITPSSGLSITGFTKPEQNRHKWQQENR